MNKTAKCPHCGKEIRLKKYARFAGEEHIITTSIVTEKGLPLPAKLLGDHINSMQGLLKEVAKSLGGKVEVFIDDIRRDDKKYEVKFLTLGVKPKPKET